MQLQAHLLPNSELEQVHVLTGDENLIVRCRGLFHEDELEFLGSFLGNLNLGHLHTLFYLDNGLDGLRGCLWNGGCRDNTGKSQKDRVRVDMLNREVCQHHFHAGRGRSKGAEHEGSRVAGIGQVVGHRHLLRRLQVVVLPVRDRSYVVPECQCKDEQHPVQRVLHRILECHLWAPSYAQSTSSVCG